MKKLLGCFLCVMLLVCIGTPVLASPIGPAVEAVYNQQDWPVFIGYSAGPNMGFDLTTYTGGAENNFTSPLYTGAALHDLINGYGGVGPYADFTGIGLNPLIAIDINEANPGNPASAAYMINSLDVWIAYGGSPVLAYSYGPTTLLQTETGNGKSDYVVPGINLAMVTSLQFVLDFGNRATGETIGDNTNGKENFFLVHGSAPSVPEPATMLLLGSGLIGLVGFRRKKLFKE